jgi:hypothetical protein
VRFYIINGNGDTGPFIWAFDSLTILSGWTDRHIDPADNIVMGNKQIKSTLDPSTVGAAQRPLCRYTTWPKYIGGDSNKANGFSCVRL